VYKVTLIVLILALMTTLVVSASAILLMGTASLTIKEPVSVSPISDTYPARSTGAKTYSNIIAIDFTKGGFTSGQSVRVKVELIINDPKIGEFRSLTIEIYKEATLVATLTKDSPVTYFDETVLSPPGTVNYDVRIIYQTGAKSVSVTFKLGVQIVYVE